MIIIFIPKIKINKKFKIIICLLSLIIPNFNIYEFMNKKINKLSFEHNFIIIIKNKTHIYTNGLLCWYNYYMRCVNQYISEGYIPIIDLASFPNILNNFQTSFKINPWEAFFDQPFNFKLKDVLNNAKKIKYDECSNNGYKKGEPFFSILSNDIIRLYYHNLVNQYIPIKKEILTEANKKYKLLFKNSNNILGILIRGTDYIGRKHHAIPPTPEKVFKDISKLKNKYDWMFIATEDDIIREKFINKFGKKLKYIKYKTNINYDYTKKPLLGFNKNIRGNFSFMRIYLINIIILSKCIDIIASRTAGTIIAFVLSKGFRNKIIYNLGAYK